MNTITVKLAARTASFGLADIKNVSDLVYLWIGTDTARMGFHLDVSPACARELAAALTAHADAAEKQTQEGGAK